MTLQSPKVPRRCTSSGTARASAQIRLSNPSPFHPPHAYHQAKAAHATCVTGLAARSHNVAQRDWRANAAWDGTSEPYTPDNDPELKYVDAELTDKGEDEARALLEHTEPHLKPQLLIVSPLRRATVTGLLAFEPHVKRGELRVMAHELCHERAGRHTCDKRLAKSKLQALYPAVDYSQLEAEEDPFWADGWTREPWQDVREPRTPTSLVGRICLIRMCARKPASRPNSSSSSP